MNKYILGIALGIAIIIGILIFSGSVQANPSLFQRSQTASATTTRSFMTPGVGTTTLVFDAGQGSRAIDSAALLIQFSASSSTSTLKWQYEYAHDTPGYDCGVTPTSCDWYEDNQELTTNATTTIQVRDSKEFSWLFASSSPGTAIIATSTNRTNKLVIVPTPTRYVRAVFYVPPLSSNVTIWAEFVGKKQI